MTGFDTENPSFDSKRYYRIRRGVVKWIKNRGKGFLVYAPGVGKTSAAMLVLAKFFKKDLTKTYFGGKVLIVVPTISLKEQWDTLVAQRGYTTVEILVINTVALQNNFTRNVDLLIIDEVHLTPADKFQRVFDRVKYCWFLGLTGTMERLDGRHALLHAIAPTVDTITQKEAIKNGWISDFIEFNLAVPITREEANTQVELGKQIRYFMSRFGDFDNMLRCMNRANAINYANYLNQGSQNDEDKYSYTDVLKWATQGIRLIHRRKDFLDNTEHKIKAAYELINEFNVRTITFSQSTAFADELAKRLGDNTKVYHSSLASETRFVEKTKLFKREASAEKKRQECLSKDFPARYQQSSNGYTVIWQEPKGFPGTKVAKDNLNLFIKGKIRNLICAKALDQGIDIPDARLGITSSRSENPAQQSQRSGRTGRVYLENGKHVTKVFVNLYVPDWSVPNSRDEQKLRKAQKHNPDRPIWVNDLDELKEMLREIIKDREDNSFKSKLSIGGND